MRYRKENGEEVIVYTADEKERALQVSLTSLAASLGYTPVRQGAHCSLKEMDSLVIYNDQSWYRWSGKGNKSGGSQIDFLLEFAGIKSVPAAVQYLLEFQGERIQEVDMEAAKKRKESSDHNMVLPEKSKSFRRLYAYLIQTRGLSQEVVSDFVHRKLIYEEQNHHNIVYCGYDPQGKIRYAGMRGTGEIYGRGVFKGDVPGNDKNYGVNIVNRSSEELKVFESVIDCMSYIDMYGDVKSNKLILGMVEDTPLVQFLEDYPHIKVITFCLDSDIAAHKALYGDAESNGKPRRIGHVKKYSDLGYAVNVESVPYEKDYNKCLTEIKSICKSEDVPLRERVQLLKDALDAGYLLHSVESDTLAPLCFANIETGEQFRVDGWRCLEYQLAKISKENLLKDEQTEDPYVFHEERVCHRTVR